MPQVKRQRNTAVTLLEALMVLAVLAVLALLLLPALRAPRVKEDWGSCGGHLKGIGLSFRLWAEDNEGKYPMQVSVAHGGTKELVANGEVVVHFKVLSNYLSTPTLIWCPADSGRTRARDWGINNSNVSYFLGVDAVSNYPAMLLAGDRKFTVNGKQTRRGMLSLRTDSQVGWVKDIHGGKGNIVFVDGHAEYGSMIKDALRRSGVTNRLAIP